jgi:hypothetical protein
VSGAAPFDYVSTNFRPCHQSSSTTETTMPTSLRAYARHRGVSLAAVQGAIDAGRLRESVIRDEHGTRKIGDVALADREWQANTLPRAGQPDTRPPAPYEPMWPDWAPEWVHALAMTPADVLGHAMRDHALAVALARLHLEQAPDPETAAAALLERLRPLLADAPAVPGFAPVEMCASLTLDEAVDQLHGLDDDPEAGERA